MFNADIDTKGLVYPRALQQTTTGIYLSLVCTIGLFAINTATGPLILMIIFTVICALFHFSLNSALDPLLSSLPRDLEIEEQSLLSLEDGTAPTNGVTTTEKGATDAAMMKNGVDESISPSATGKSLPSTPTKPPNFFSKWLRPDLYTDYHTLRKLVPRDFAEIIYSAEAERHAYYNPAISSPTPLLWIPRDSMGVSAQEIRHTSKVIPISDEGAFFDDKGNMVFDQESRPPIYQDKIYY